jgi:spermidine synthase
MRSLRSLILVSVIGTGISSVSVQLLTVREFLSQFHGNEITISLVLFNWLLLTGLGSLAAKLYRRPGPGFYGVLCVILGLWPLLQLLAIRWGREAAFLHGSDPGFYAVFLFVLAATAPYCIMAGFILPCALDVLRDEPLPLSAGGLYITDSIGDIIGGVLFSFFLVYWFKPFTIVVLTSALLIGLGMVLAGRGRRMLRIALVPPVCAFLYVGLNAEVELESLAPGFGEIVRYEESPYGRIVITRDSGAHTFWESGVPLRAGTDLAHIEEKVHYPLSQVEEVGRVLLVSGGIGGTLQEVRKHNPGRVDYVELDPNLTQAARELGLLEPHPGLSVKNTDGRRYLGTTETRYDAVILDLPDPDTFQLNRFFTEQFFALTEQRLTRGGVFCFSLAYYPNYLTDLMRRKLSSIYHTARLHFSEVVVIPGNRAFFLCRNGPLSKDIPALLRAKSIETAYISGYYDGSATPDRFAMLERAVEENEHPNSDFQPRVINIAFQEWFLRHETSPRPFLAGLAVFTLIYLLFVRREEFVLFTTGFATMGAEMLVLFSFQVLHGYVYLKIGAIVTAFLAGLLPGSLLGALRKEKARGRLLAADLVLALLLVGFYVWVRFFGGTVHDAWFLAYGFLFSFFCGFQFPAAAGLIGEDKRPAAGCLAADLTGAAVGTLVVGAMLIPFLGIQTAAVLLILVKVSSNVAMLFPGRGGA